MQTPAGHLLIIPADYRLIDKPLCVVPASVCRSSRKTFIRTVCESVHGKKMGLSSFIIYYCHCDYARGEGKRHSITIKCFVLFFFVQFYSLTAEASLCLDQSFSSSLNCISTALADERGRRWLKCVIHSLTITTCERIRNVQPVILIRKITFDLVSMSARSPTPWSSMYIQMIDIVQVDVDHGTSEI